MDIYETLLGLAVVFAIPGVTWFLVRRCTSDITKKICDIEIKQHDLREKLPIDYVRAEQYGRDIRDIKDLLKNIFDKLDKKADK